MRYLVFLLFHALSLLHLFLVLEKCCIQFSWYQLKTLLLQETAPQIQAGLVQKRIQEKMRLRCFSSVVNIIVIFLSSLSPIFLPQLPHLFVPAFILCHIHQSLPEFFICKAIQGKKPESL